jgi:tRNA (guanine-N7-)-methyltransferase
MQRIIKSFVLRAGRISPRQQAGLDDALPQFALPAQAGIWDLPAIFGRDAETWVEIGFGMGASLLASAQAHPHLNFIGIEVHRAGIGSLAASLADQAMQNVRIAPFDACEVFNTCIADESLAGVQIFFPDPWPKKRHHKRRLIQPEFVRLITQKIKAGGILHCATDWQDYAVQMLDVLTAEKRLEGGIVPRPTTRPLTKFEQRGLKLGHGVWDLVYNKT